MLSDVLQDILDEGVGLLGEHLVLVVTSILIAAALAIPSGLLLASHPRARNAALALAGVGQTIPSLALFGFLIPIPFIGGIGAHTAIIALVLYALLPILRNTVTGILGVDSAVRDSAVAMGMTRRQILRMVELPLAAPTIIAGLRIATVTTIGTATIAAAIGAGGLGVFIFRGIASVDKLQILAGAIPAALLAILADAGLGWIEKRCAAF
jgi:osmoprotectant transport system permease protein